MAAETKVVDASVIMKLFAPEAGSQEAEELLERHQRQQVFLLAPELLLLEVTNALRYKGKTAGGLLQDVRKLYRLRIHLEHLNEFLLERASALALQHDLSIYDALYAALSEAADAPLVTADRELAGKVPGAKFLGAT